MPTDLTIGLKHYWKFDEKTESGVWRDFGSDGGLTHFSEHTVGSIQAVTGKISQAIKFSGSDANYIEAADALSLRATQGDFAIGFWFKIYDLSLSQQNIIHKTGATGALVPEYRVYFRGPTKTLRFVINFPSGTREVVVTTPTLEADQWNYVAAIFKQGDGLRIMFNPSPSSLGDYFIWTETPTDYGSQFSPLRAGGDSVTTSMLGGGEPFDGVLDELAIWQGTVPELHDFFRIYNSGNGLPFEEWGAAEDCRTTDCCPPDPYAYRAEDATDSEAGSNMDCPEVIVEVTPTIFAPLFFPAYIVLRTNNPDAVIRYTTNGFEPTPVSTVYTGPFQVTSSGMIVQARAFVGDCSPGPITTIQYQNPPFPMGLVYACDTPDKGGTWGVFAPNGVVDNHWQLTFVLSGATTIKRLEMYQTNALGVWDTGIMWSTDEFVTLENGTVFQAMPLLVFVGAVQQWAAYQSSLGSWGATTHTWELYGERWQPSSGFFRLDMILADNTRISSIIRGGIANCTALPPVACPSPGAPTATPKCDGKVDVTFPGTIGQNYKVFVSPGSGWTQVAAGAMAASPTTIEVSGLTKGALYYFRVELEYTDCGYQSSIPVTAVPKPDPSVSISSDKLIVDPNESFTISWNSNNIGGAVCGGCLDGQVGIDQGLGCKAGNAAGSQSTSKATPGDYTYTITGCNTCGTAIATVVVTVRDPAACVEPQPSIITVSGGNSLDCGACFASNNCHPVWNGQLHLLGSCFWGRADDVTGGCLAGGGPCGFHVRPSVVFNSSPDRWTLTIIEASTLLVLWQGTKLFGASPAGTYNRTAGCAPSPATLSVS
jgi:hypothetical protein